MPRPQSNRTTLSIHSQDELLAAQNSLEDCTYESVGLLITDPSLLCSSSNELHNLTSSLKAVKALKEIRLAVRGPGKLAVDNEIGNTVEADAVADLVTRLAEMDLPLSLEISVSTVKGSLDGLCAAIVDCQQLFRCVIHECNNEDDARQQGMLPFLKALSHCPSLHTLVLEAVRLPVGDITSSALTELSAHTNLKRLEIKHCIDLGDEELVPMVSSITNLQHLKLSTGMGIHQAHTGRQWGTRTVAAIASKLQDPDCSMTSLALTTSEDHVSFRSIVQATATNKSLQRLHLSPPTKNPKLGLDMIQILESNQNTTLLHCNAMGLGHQDMSTLQFYTRLNQLHRDVVFQSNNNLLWIDTLLEQSRDHRIVHYFLTHNPMLLLNATIFSEKSS